MNKLISTILIGLCISFITYSQSPNSFQYQAIARDATGVALTDQEVMFRISILEETTDGAAVYAETHASTSNSQGLINLKIGEGNVISGDISAIDWGSGPHFLKIEMDPSGGNNYILTGTSQLLSVPYALYAEKTEQANTFNILSDKGLTPCDESTKGAVRYDETSNTVVYCNGSNWISLASGLSVGLPQVLTVNVGEITTSSALVEGSIESNEGAEIFEKGVCWNTGGTPTKNDFSLLKGSGNEPFSCLLENLTSYETYYVRTFATNTAGTGYGMEENFQTPPSPAIVSETKTGVFNNENSFSTGGNADVAGKESILERGVVYGNTPGPTKEDNYLTAGTGVGDFDAIITFAEDATIYFRSYAINEEGINYGPEKFYKKYVVPNENRIMVMPTSSGATTFTTVRSDSWYSPNATSMDDGNYNTMQLISRFGNAVEAAYMCDTTTARGFSDWYLPAVNELVTIYQYKDTLGLNLSDGYYWSSTDVSYKDAYCVDFTTGNPETQDRMTTYNVVCIRRDNE